MSTPTWLPGELPVDRPNQARMYDYLLGGYHNFAIDRNAAEQLIAINPDAPLITQSYRAFLRRAVRFLVAQGIDQFLDLGSVTPTVGSTHEIAQQLNSAARVVYVDIDPDTVRHSEAILRDTPHTTVIQADIRQLDQILDHPDARRLLDFSQPVAVLFALLHFVTEDEQAYNLVHVLRNALPPASCFTISHGTYEETPSEVTERVEALYARSTTPVKFRSRAEIAAFFDGLDLVEPGLVYEPLWRPEGPDDLLLDQPERSATFVGVGCKP